MSYRGRVTNGVVVFDEHLSLPEGTVVKVEPMLDGAEAPPRGSAAAILNSPARWHGSADEMDRLLAELRERKWAELESQSGQ